MKPLELTIYPKLGRHMFQTGHHGDAIYQVQVLAESIVIQSKRLSDAELAAEYHAANSDAWRAHSAKRISIRVLEDRFETFSRFATLPHYDEPTP